MIKNAVHASSERAESRLGGRTQTENFLAVGKEGESSQKAWLFQSESLLLIARSYLKDAEVIARLVLSRTTRRFRLVLSYRRVLSVLGIDSRAANIEVVWSAAFLFLRAAPNSVSASCAGGPSIAFNLNSRSLTFSKKIVQVECPQPVRRGLLQYCERTGGTSSPHHKTNAADLAPSSTLTKPVREET